MIAGDHLHADAGAAAFGDRLDGFLAGRIEFSLEAEESQIRGNVFVVDRVLLRVNFPAGEGKHTQAAGGHGVCDFQHCMRIGQCQLAVFIELMGATGGDDFHRAFDIDGFPLCSRAVESGHILSVRLERYALDSRKILAEAVLGQPAFVRGNQQRALGGIAFHCNPAVLVRCEARVVAEQACAKGFDERAVVSNIEGLLLEMDRSVRIVAAAGDVVEVAAGVDFADGHLVAGECAGFVRADHGGASERFHGGQFSDDGLLFCHPGNADGQRDGDCGRQAFGDRADGERDGGHEKLAPVLAAPEADGEGQRGEAEDDVKQQLAEICDLPGQRCEEVFRPVDHAGDASHLGMIGGGEDDSLARAIGDEGARESEVPTIRQGKLGWQIGDGFAGGLGLAGQGGLLDLEVALAQQAEVGGHAVAGL